MNIEDYKGHEQTFIKHTLLSNYIECLFMIIGQSKKTICYVDCFAGPWQEGGNDLSDTSIAISLNIMKKCHEGLLKHGRNVRFRALFIEKEKKPFEKLTKYLESETCEGIQTEAKHGEFFHLREEILKWCGDRDFTFFFVDPTGWKNVVEIETLRPLLNRQNSEYMINFMFDFIRRTVPQDAFEKEIKGIFGEIPDMEGLPSFHKEDFLLNLYLTRLKEAQVSSGSKPRAARVQVLDPLKDRTKYYLVYLTRHPKGIEVFMDTSEKIDFIQRQIRAKTKQNHREIKTHQKEMFPTEVKTKDHDDLDINDVKKYWLDHLTNRPKQFDIEVLADMMEETGWFKSDLQRALKELIVEGKVENIEAKKIRPKNVIDFNKGEHLVRVV